LEDIYNNKKSSSYKTFSTDGGSEFKGLVKKLLKEYHINVYTAHPGDHRRQGIIERFNRTLLSKIKKYFKFTDTLNWVDSLEDFIENYNNTEHSFLQAKPIDIYNGKDTAFQQLQTTSKKGIQKFTVGDLVKHEKENKTFDKKRFLL